jgi:hypothetical protein
MNDIKILNSMAKALHLSPFRIERKMFEYNYSWNNTEKESDVRIVLVWRKKWTLINEVFLYQICAFARFFYIVVNDDVK